MKKKNVKYCFLISFISLTFIEQILILNVLKNNITDCVEQPVIQQQKEIKIIYTTEKESLSEDTSESNSVEVVTDKKPIYTLTENEEYLLAKISQCEAGNCSIETRIKVMQCVYNRMLDDKFPNRILDVLYENTNGIYQFSPVASGGSWYYKEPTEKDYEALELFKSKIYDDSEGVLYFEDCTNTDNWHSRNLEYINTYDGIRFYR